MTRRRRIHCAIRDCDAWAVRRGLCQRHFNAARYRKGKTGESWDRLVELGLAGARMRDNEGSARPICSRYEGPCLVKDCGRPQLARGLCATHYDWLYNFIKRGKTTWDGGTLGLGRP